MKRDKSSKIDSIVVPGLFSNPQHFRFQSYKNIFKSFGLSTKIICGPTDLLQDRKLSFYEAWIELIESQLLENPATYGISSSIGSSILLIALFRVSKKINITGNFVLIGLDPNVEFRMKNMPKEQINIWRESLNISTDLIENALIFDTSLQKELEEAIILFKHDKKVNFIHGDSDATIPLSEILKLELKNLDIINGLGHNSANKLEESIVIIYKKLFGLHLVPFYNNKSLLQINYFNQEVIGFFPIDMNERIRWSFIINSSRLRINPKYDIASPVSFSTDEVIHNRLALGKVNKYYLQFDLSKIISSREFYYVQFPMLSYFPSIIWTENFRIIIEKVNDNMKIVKNDPLHNEYEESLRKYYDGSRKLKMASIEELKYFNNENRLYMHCFNVYNILLKFGIREDLALEISILHDIGKGLWIKLAQLRELNNQERVGQVVIEDVGIRRRLGGYIKYVGDKSKIEKLNKKFEKYSDYIFGKIDITDETISKEIVKTNQSLISPEALIIINDFFANKSIKHSQVLILSDLISDFRPASLKEYKRALDNKEYSLRKRWPNFNSRDFDIARQFLSQANFVE